MLLAPVALVVEGPPPAALSATNLAGHGYLGLIGAALAYALWFRGVKAMPATPVTFLSLLSPVVATAVGWLALGQQLTALQALGALLVLAAVVVAQFHRQRPAPRGTVSSGAGQVGREALASGHDVTV